MDEINLELGIGAELTVNAVNSTIKDNDNSNLSIALESFQFSLSFDSISVDLVVVVVFCEAICKAR